MQEEEHRPSVEVQDQGRAGDEQELEYRPDQPEPQHSYLPKLHIEQIDERGRAQRKQATEHELRYRDGRERCDGFLPQPARMRLDLR